MGEGYGEAEEAARLLDVSVRFSDLTEEKGSDSLALLFEDDTAKRLLHVNEHDGVLWFGKEPFERLLDFVGSIRAESGKKKGKRLKKIVEAASKSGYRVEDFLKVLP